MTRFGQPSRVALSLAAGACMSMFAVTGQALAQANVVATIPAVHSIVSGVMGKTATPHLLVSGAASPHTYSLKPSDARALADAQLVVWVGPQLETFLADELKTLAPDAHVTSLQSLDGAITRDIRVGGLWDAHDHGAHGGDDGHEEHDDHAGHDEHDHDKHDDDAHDHDKHDDHAASSHDDHGHDEHAHGNHADHDAHKRHDDHAGTDDLDAHMWLDPRNAIILSKAVAAELSRIDPSSAATYEANHAAQVERLEALDTEISGALEAVSDVPFIVFHDAYQYFEARYELSSVGSITVSPEVAPGAARVRAMQERIRERGAQCVFAEPQFKPSILEAVIEGTDARAGVLDPVGADLEPGEQMYPQLIRKLTEDLSACLAS